MKFTAKLLVKEVKTDSLNGLAFVKLGVVTD